jgi:subtilisin family serine protease
MGEQDPHTDGVPGLGRRQFLTASGTLAALGLAGVPTAGAATGGDLSDQFTNVRTREAAHVWARGYRGRPDRTVALTDSGIEARHPDIGPWSGVTAFVDADGQLQLTKPEKNTLDRVSAGDAPSFSGTVGPGTFATGEEVTHEFTTPTDVDELDASLSWGVPDANDLEFRLDRYLDGEWQQVARAATADEPETISTAIQPDTRHRFVVKLYLSVADSYEITGEYFELRGSRTPVPASTVFADAGSDPGDAKVVGWYDAGTRYGSYDRPRDPNGHGSHCTSIMAGTGRASTVDASTVVEEEPRTVLAEVLGETLEYEVEADAGTGVFGSAYGTGITLRIEGPDGETLDQSSADTDSGIQDNVIVEAPAETTGTYTVYVQAASNVALSAAYVREVATGAFLDPDGTSGARTGEETLHAGVAPDQSVVGLQGLSGPTNDLGTHATDFARLFNMRAVNMSWGYTGGLPLGSAGGTLDTIPADIKDIAEAGVLTVAAAGNAATPANGNGSPGIADECISVVATGPLDGISAYSSGGLAGLDEDADFSSPEPDDGYMKPDVTAPGGYLDDLVIAAKTGQPDTDEDAQPPIREYTGKAGTSMAAPFTTGTAGLLAQAMEEDAPDALALPAPEDTGIEDVFRLKSTLLATASETVFTAAPYHRVKAPTYDFGGRDPFEGYGRVNPGAAVDAATRELSGTTSDVVGLNVPADERAVAGYVQAGPGTVTASVEFDYYSGAQQADAKEAPHVDLFVYDAATPAAHGEPNVLARAQGLQGAAEASVAFGRDAGEQTLYVVAKLVNVPGAVNGDDVQAHLDLSVDVENGVFADGTRTDDGSAFTGGQTNQIDLTVDPSEPATVRDVVPAEWTVLTDYSDDVDRVETGEGVKYVYFTEEAAADTETAYTYFAEAPSEPTFTNAYTFGPLEVALGGTWTGVSGTSDTNVVAGATTTL